MLSIRTFSVNSRNPSGIDALSEEARFVPKIRHMIALMALLIAVGVAPCAADDPDKSASELTTVPLGVGLTAEFRLPPGFIAGPATETGVMKWTKNRAEVFLVVGTLLSESADLVYEELLTAVKKHRRVEAVEEVSVSSGRAFLYKEKSPENPSRIRIWRLVIVLDERMVNVDCAAPEKEFSTYAADFTKVLKSFKIMVAE